MTSLKDKIAVVTGAGGGIGSVTAILLAERGAKVVVADLDLESAERTVAEIRSKGSVALAVRFDLAEEESVRALMRAAVDSFGRIDILYNCAADLSYDVCDVEHMDVEIWDRYFRINTRGTMLCCKHALPHMPHHAGASIINTASNLALQGSIILVGYSASKAAVLQMTRCIAASHGKLGIRCNAVSPGLIMTPANVRFLPTAARDLVESETLAPHLGEPNDVANAVAFLASDDARHINGHNLVVDGGTCTHIADFAQMWATKIEEGQ